MAIPKGTYRKRRKTGLSGIPRNIQEWFAGVRRFSFYAYTPPYRGKLPKYWAAWVAENPGATKPEGLQTLLNTSAYPSWYDGKKDDE